MPPAESAGQFLAAGTRLADFTWVDESGLNRCLSDFRGGPLLLALDDAVWDPARAEDLAQFEHLLQRSGLRGALAAGAAPLEKPEWLGRLGLREARAMVLIDERGVVLWSHRGPSGSPQALLGLETALHACADRTGVTRRGFLITTLALGVLGSLPLAARAQAAAPANQPRLPDASGGLILNVNGQDYPVGSDPRTTVLDALRERIGLTGTKKGCDHGQCGACTVMLNDRTVNSCLTLAAQAVGERITTIEGLANGVDLHPVQAAFIRHDGFQCGYCTPGQILSAVACIRDGHAHDRDEIRVWMSGNLCRCGAYNGICEAVEEARDHMAEARA